LVCLGWVLTHFLGNIAKTEVEGDGVSHLRILTQEVTNTFKEAEQIVKNLSESPLIVSALGSDDPIALEQANSVLDRYNKNFNLAVCYLLDVHGKAIASSNRNAPDSFVGVSYRFRPYYQQPMQGSWGHHFTMGIRTNKHGYFVSYPVKDSVAKVIGVAVLKVDVDYLEKKLISSNGNKPPALVIDNYGLVVISTQPDLLFKTLWPVPEDIRLILLEQYLLKDVSSIFSKAYTSGSDVLLEQHHYLLFMNSAYTNFKLNWSIACLTPYTAIARYRFIGILITFILISLAVMYAYRNLWFNELNETLERRVIERTEALRTEDCQPKLTPFCIEN
jgi:C4-dicarboxylate-specific signal transduction histidine kinase